MKIFDTLNAASPSVTVIDVRAGLMSPTLTSLRDIGFLDAARPKLNEMAFEQVEVASVPFLKFVANKGMDGEAADYSFVLRGYVRHWLTNVWREFDRIQLTDLVGASKSARIERKAS